MEAKSAFGLVFEDLPDDSHYSPSATPETFDKNHDFMVTEAVWSNPKDFGHIETSFANHIAMISKRSEELGIVNEYSTELLSRREDIARLQSTMMSYDAFFQAMCACPEDFGMSSEFTSQIFGTNNNQVDDHNHASELSHIDHQDDDDDEHDHKKKKNKTKNSSSGKIIIMPQRNHEHSKAA